MPLYNSYRFNMATKPLKRVGKKKQPAGSETSESIQDKVNAFLAAGGEIEQVQRGVSGQSIAPSQKPKPKPAETSDSS